MHKRRKYIDDEASHGDDDTEHEGENSIHTICFHAHDNYDRDRMYWQSKGKGRNVGFGVRRSAVIQHGGMKMTMGNRV